MRFLKKPVSKRNSLDIPWKQDGFSNSFPDQPASEIPRGGVASARNALLFGDRFFIRPGDEIHVATGLPLDATQPFTSGIVKTGTSVTHSGNGFTADMVGRFLVWDDNTTSLIVAFVGVGEVTVDDSGVQADTAVDIRSAIWGNYWHEKSGLIFLHIGTRLFYTEWNFASGWTEIVLPSGSSLGQSRSKFDSEEELVYVFNIENILLVDITDEDSITATPINLASAPNTIGPMTDEQDGTPGTLSRYLPSSEETILNKYGRKYLYSMVRLDGNGSNHRGDGTRIIKESGSNTFPASNDYVDYKESWRVHGLFNADNLDPTSRTYGVTAIDVSSESLINYINFPPATFQIAIDGNFRDVYVDFTEIEDWIDVSDAIEKGLKSAFPEYKYVDCSYDEVNRELVIFSGEATNSVSGLGSPSGGGFDLYTNSWSGFETVYQIPAWAALGTQAVPALKEPVGQYAYTHFGVYSTITLGKHTIVDGNETVNSEYFIWQKDVPIIKPFFVLYTGFDNNILNGELTIEDLGSWVFYANGDTEKISRRRDNYSMGVHNNGGAVHNNSLISSFQNVTLAFKLVDLSATFITSGVTTNHFVTNLALASSPSSRILSVDSETQLTLELDIFQSLGETYIIGGDVCAIGSEEPMLCTKSGNTVTKILPASGTFDFEAADIGKPFFWDDGTIDIITAINSVTSIETLKSSTKLVSACAFEPSGRNYNDGITDLTLGDRSASFAIQNRFYDALPASDIGAIIPGFMVVAAEDAVRGYYSQFANATRYLAGHYYAEFQNFRMTDTIKELSRIPNQLIIFCKNSTWRFQTNVVSSVQDTRVGENIPILSGLGVVDENVGIPDRLGVVSYSTGYKMVVTSEPGVRLFDGYRYSSNKLMDEAGRGHYKGEFQTMKRRIVAYYEPNMYGMMFWGTNDIQLNGDGLPLLAKANKSFRMAVETQQGFGWSELDGDLWNFIEMNHQPMFITDNKGDKFTILFDTNLGYPHRLSTRKIPSLTEVAGDDLNFKDNEDVGGGNGTDIDWALMLREHLAPDEEFNIRYKELYLHLRPYKESNKGVSGYDQYGFLSTQEITIKAFTDGNALSVSEAYTVDPKATIYQPYHVEDRRVQIEISGTASELIGTTIKALYDEIFKRRPPGSQKETGYQQTMATHAFRVSRSFPKQLELTNGQYPDAGEATFHYDRNGPDGRENSAFSILYNFPAFNYIYTLSAILSSFGDRDIIFSIFPENDGVSDVYDEIGNNGARFRIYSALDSVEFYLNEVLVATITITYEWNTVLVSFRGSTLYVSFTNDGETITKSTHSLINGFSHTMTSPYTITLTGEGTIKLFDILMFIGQTITDDLFKYYVRDVYKYAGVSLLPAQIIEETDEEYEE